VIRRILLPHLYPAIGAGGGDRLLPIDRELQYTLFTRGTYDTLTVYVFSKVRSGITPTINALALILIAITILGVLWYEISRRRSVRKFASLATPGA
jgi:ABC-type spermidine/putrescine transport system, permease component II